MDLWMENNQVLGVRHEGRRTLEALSRIGSEGKSSACNVGDLGSIPESGRSPGEGNGNYSGTLAWKIPWKEKPDRL